MMTAPGSLSSRFAEGRRSGCSTPVGFIRRQRNVTAQKRASEGDLEQVSPRHSLT